MAYSPSTNNYIRSASGIWTPVGFAAGDLGIPIGTSNGTVNSRSDGFLNTRSDPTSLLFDTFETIDTTNTWSLGGTTFPTGTNGVLSVSSGTAALAQSFARSQTSFTPGSNAYLTLAFLVTLEAAVVTGNKRVWGLGVPNGVSPTVAVPLTNGAVFEIQDTDGALIGAVYSGSVRTQTVALTRPVDGLVHRYSTLYRTSRVYFEIDNVQVGSLPFPNPQISSLPLVIASINGATALGSAAVLTSTLMGIADTGKNSTQLSDATYPWRKAAVRASGAQEINIASSAGNVAGTTGSLSAGATDTQGTATTVSTAGQVIANVSTAGNTTFHLQTNAFVGTVAFEASLNNGVNYAPIFSVREDGTGGESSSSINTAAAFIRAYTVGMPGFTHFRVRASVFTSGTLSVVINQGPLLIETSPSLGASTATIGAVTGTGTAGTASAGVLTVQGIASGVAQPVSLTTNTPDVTDRAARLLGVLSAGSSTIGSVGLVPSTLVVTATAAAGTAVTATLAAAGAGLFHYIANIRIERFTTVATTAANAVLLTGGVNQSLVFNLPNDAVGLGVQSVVVDYRPTVPLRSTTANTATTITTPIVANTIYRITVTYYTAV